MTDTLSDTCSVTLQGEAPSTGQTTKHKQKQDTGIDKTHLKAYDNSYIPLAVLEDKFLKLHVKCRTKFLKAFLHSRSYAERARGSDLASCPLTECRTTDCPLTTMHNFAVKVTLNVCTNLTNC